MIKAATALTLICACIQAQVAVLPPRMTAELANPVVQWNRNLFAIVPALGAQAAHEWIAAPSLLLSPLHLLPGNQFHRGPFPTLTTNSFTNAFERKSFADGVNTFYDAKYKYNTWRQVTALRAAKTKNSADTLANQNWLLDAGYTTPESFYPGARVVIVPAYFQTELTKLLRRIL